jgi:hypothetical protein
MGFPCQITNAAGVQLGYETPTAFGCQKWLRENAWICRCMYIASLVNSVTNKQMYNLH